LYRETVIVSDSSDIPPSGDRGPDVFGDMVINVGPQHPSTHGVLHLVITLNGETIKKVEPHLGYIHRSIEKMCESLTFRQFIYVTSKMDYLSSHINNHGCCLCADRSAPKSTGDKGVDG
jgi:NADH-quinone oxidoreductase subunit D/NADH-quinone oxidoreductase subunit C/D